MELFPGFTRLLSFVHLFLLSLVVAVDLKDEADAQVHVAVGENVVVIGVDAQVDGNRAVPELKPGNSTYEPPKTDRYSSMLWQLELNVIFSGVGIKAKAVEAVDGTGNVIAEYCSASLAARVLGVRKQAVSAIIGGKEKGKLSFAFILYLRIRIHELK